MDSLLRGIWKRSRRCQWSRREGVDLSTLFWGCGKFDWIRFMRIVTQPIGLFSMNSLSKWPKISENAILTSKLRSYKSVFFLLVKGQKRYSEEGCTSVAI